MIKVVCGFSVKSLSLLGLYIVSDNDFSHPLLMGFYIPKPSSPLDYCIFPSSSPIQLTGSFFQEVDHWRGSPWYSSLVFIGWLLSIRRYMWQFVPSHSITYKWGSSFNSCCIDVFSDISITKSFTLSNFSNFPVLARVL